MTTLQYVHFSIELWGAFFCLIATISIAINRDFDKKGSGKLIALMLSSVMLMISDALAWFFRGNMTETGYYMVRISNFSAFFFGFLTMPLVAEYLTHIIKRRSGVSGLYWKYIEWGLFFIGTAMLVLNTFHEFIYTFDARNTYYRLAFGLLPGIVAFIGIVITLGVVFEYLRYMYTFEKIATLIYLLLPVVAVVIQSIFYGISFTYLSIVISALMLFISYEVNYVRYYSEKERKLAEERIRLFNQQIQPHFVFNSLSIIRYLCRKSPDDAIETIDEFSGYLRKSADLMNTESCVPVSREIDLVKNYVYMQKKRFGDSISYEFEINDTDFEIPPFTIQTLVENAIEHGFRLSGIESGTISVKTYLKDKNHFVEIKDTGIGFDTDSIDDDSQTEHVGIRNTRERLRLMLGGTLSINSKKGEGTEIIIQIPEGN